MMTTDKLAGLYTVVLRREEELEIAREILKHTQKTNRLDYDKARRQVDSIRDELAMAQQVFKAAINRYSKIYRNIPFYRKSKEYTVKLKRKTVTFYFDRHGIPSFVGNSH